MEYQPEEPEAEVDLMEVEGQEEGQPNGPDEEMIDVDDVPVTQEDAWAVIR